MEIIKDNDIFVRSRTEIADIYHNAFLGYPWFENLSKEELDRRLDDNISRVGFESFLVQDNDGQLIGGLWYDTPSLEDLEKERGSVLANFARNMMKEKNINNLVWEREVMVSPEHTGKGVATNLRETFLLHLKDKYPSGVLILTRMMDNNFAIIKIAEKFGYQRSGIKTPSIIYEDVCHDYWFKLVE